MFFMMNYKAAFIDMDGTLLRKDHTVSAYTQQVIQSFISQGKIIVPVSARPLHGMLHITNQFLPPTTPIVSLNGSYIYHEGKIIYQIHIDSTITQSIAALVDAYDVSAMYYNQMEWFAKSFTLAVAKEQKITPVAVTIQTTEQSLAQWQAAASGPNKILIAGEVKLIDQLEVLLKAKVGSELNIFKSQPRYVELMHQQASKTAAIQRLMEMYQLKQEEIIAIGDNYNDQGMIEFAGMGIAMGNAPDSIKQVANDITDTNNQDGVAKALIKYF